MKDKIEILPIDLINDNRDLVDLVYTLSDQLKIGLGWHYILDIVWIVTNIKDLPKGSIVLDAGGGNGLLQFVLASLGYKIVSVDFSPRIPPQVCKKNWDIIEIDSGIDYDNEYIQHLKENFSAAKTVNQSVIKDLSTIKIEDILYRNSRTIIYYRSDFTDMELINDGSIDCIVSLSALEHNNPETIQDAVNEFKRILKTNHRMLITTSAANKKDWFHEPSRGWCLTEKSIIDQFDLNDYESNYNLYSELFDKLKAGKGLRENLAPFYFKSANNGMPLGIWDPKYQPVGVLKVKTSSDHYCSQTTKEEQMTMDVNSADLSLKEPDNTDKGNNIVNVVLNFHKKDQHSAGMLLELLMAVDEGVECKYHLQYGNNINTLKITETIIKFIDKKNADFSSELPDIMIPQDMIDNDPNLLSYEGNHAVRNRMQKKSILQWNLCLYKYIHRLDSFLMIEPDCVVLKHGWLKDIYTEWEKYSGPIFGHLKKGLIQGKHLPTHWAGCSFYDSIKLRELPLEHYFYDRYDNPWWKYRDNEGTETANNCFYGPVVSGYDVSFDYFLFALYWKVNTGSNDPFSWPLDKYEDRQDLIFCDFKTKMSGSEIFRRFAGRLPIMHGVKDDSVREMMIKYFYSEACGKPESMSFPLSGPSNSPVKNNDKYVTIHDLKDKFKGERCFIIGNGPSLKKTDMRPLNNEYSIGANRIYLNYENMGFEPTFYCSVNPHVIEQFSKEIDALKSIKFIRSGSKKHLENMWNTFFMDSFGAHDFNQDLANLEWCEGWTVTYCALQVAFYLGFHTVILVGVDHNFPKSGDPNKLVTADSSDQNHFHPDYFGKGIKWQYPDLERSEKSYTVAREIYEKNGRIIFDATVGGKLNIFPKINYNEMISMPVNGSTPLALNKKGEELFNRGDAEGALDTFLKAVEIAPGYATAYNNIGVIYWQSGEMQKASEYFAKALSIDPDDRSVIINCGRLLTSFDNTEDTKKIYSSYLERNPDDEEISRLLTSF